MVIRTNIINNLILALIAIIFSKISCVFLFFLALAIVRIYFDKIEYDGNNIIIKYILGNTVINVNSIQSIKIVTMLPFSVKKNISQINWQNTIIIYYLSSKNERKGCKLRLINCPGFIKIIDRILQIKPNLEIVYTNSEY
ncbi:MAG: hypothetical protein KAU07_03450 [Candidatus Andersenbacteria bacterium]|nr:hypothetical protein [Candidatus Andersenbacteria bacterium]